MHITHQQGQILGKCAMPGGVATIVGKFRIVHDWEPLNNVKDIRSFLGFANYCRQFVLGYAIIATPLMLLMKKNIEWHWGLVQCRAF